MSDTQPEPQTEPTELPAPDDVDSKTATGVGVFNRTLQRFEGGKFASKSDADAYLKDKAKDGHDYVTRKV